jgi:glycosyltransferase involved in cell wall biosynthesis
MPIAALPRWYRRCTVHVNLTPKGFVDKVALEAMSCAKPCLVANEGFRETLDRFAQPLLFRHGDPADLAEKLRAIFLTDARQQHEIGRYLRGQVSRLHSLQSLSKRLVDILGGPGKGQALAVPLGAGRIK